mgnify:CR=1 FL=1
MTVFGWFEDLHMSIILTTFFPIKNVFFLSFAKITSSISEHQGYFMKAQEITATFLIL